MASPDHTNNSPNNHTPLATAQRGDWSQFFTPDPAIDLGKELLFRGNHADKIALIAEDPPLLSSAVHAALERGAWDFISDILGSPHAGACPPGALRASTSFKTPLSVRDGSLTSQEAAKLSLWRSILTANPWYQTTLAEHDYLEWKDLSEVVIKSLAFSSVPANEFSNPGHLVHVVDAVNQSMQATNFMSEGSQGSSNNSTGEQTTPKGNNALHSVRPHLAIAAASLVETLEHTSLPISLSKQPLASLNLSAMAASPAIKDAFLQGITHALTPVAAKSFLHALATDESRCPDLKLRVSALTTLLSMSELPVATLVAVLKDAPHGEIRSIAMRALSQELAFPLLSKARLGIQSVGPSGGVMISGLLSGLDRSHSSMQSVVAFPTLVRDWISACSGAGIEHGIDPTIINSYSTSLGGPLKGSLVDFALEPLDLLSPVGIAAALRRWIRA